MISGTGIDIVEINRFRKILNKGNNAFVERVFTKQEQQYCNGAKDPSGRFAGRFAAKEAVLKALGTGLRGMRWLDIEVVRNDDGKPDIHLHGAASQLAASEGITSFYLSISHCREYAVAQAISWREG